MQRFFPAQSQFAMLAIGAAIMATLLAAAALAANHGHLPNAPLLRVLLSPTTLSRVTEICSNGLRYRHWVMSAVAKWYGALANPHAA